MSGKLRKRMFSVFLAAMVCICSMTFGKISARAAGNGFVQTEKGVMWVNEDGSFLKNNWLKFNGKTYWLNAQGLVQYGMVDVGGYTFYLYPDGQVMTGWYQGENGVSYFGSDGKMIRNGVVNGFVIGADGLVKSSSEGENRAIAQAAAQQSAAQAAAAAQEAAAQAAAAQAAAAAQEAQEAQPASAKALLVSQILAQFITPDMTPEQQLRAAYDHVLSTTSYHRTYETPSGDWTWNYAMDIFTTGQGNCYRYASAFAYLARGLGYETRVITGTISAARGGVTPHGWVEIKVGDTWYICDPDMQDCKGGNYYMRTYANYPVKPLNRGTEWPVEL